MKERIKQLAFLIPETLSAAFQPTVVKERYRRERFLSRADATGMGADLAMRLYSACRERCRDPESAHIGILQAFAKGSIDKFELAALSDWAPYLIKDWLKAIAIIRMKGHITWDELLEFMGVKDAQTS